MMESDLRDLAALVKDEGFRQKQVDFFTRYCGEFEAGEENKLAYTTIHQQYESQIEKQIEEQLGSEKLHRLVTGLEAYMQQREQAGHGALEQNQEIAEAIDVLTSLGDFPAFKAAMLARKAELQGATVSIQALKGVLTMEDCMDRINDLTTAASTADGWQEIVNTPGMVAFIKEAPHLGSTYCRFAMELDLPADLAYRMFIDVSPECIKWKDNVRSCEILRDLGPDDKIVKMIPAIPWAVRYVMSMPEEFIIRCVSKPNWPEPGNFAYVVVPFDLERNVALEEFGNFGIKSGVITPHPTDPNKSELTTADCAKLGYIPSWGLGFLIRKLASSSILSMVDRFKASETYQQALAERAGAGK